MIANYCTVLAFLLFPSLLSAGERHIVCDLFAANNPTERIESISIQEMLNGSISITSVFKKRRPFPKVLNTVFSTTTDKTIEKDRFSTVVTENSSHGEVFVPTHWLIDWNTSTVSLTNLGFSENMWTIYKRYQCARVYK